jgi:hypothetical protein
MPPAFRFHRHTPHPPCKRRPGPGVPPLSRAESKGSMTRLGYRPPDYPVIPGPDKRTSPCRKSINSHLLPFGISRSRSNVTGCRRLRVVPPLSIPPLSIQARESSAALARATPAGVRFTLFHCAAPQTPRRIQRLIRRGTPGEPVPSRRPLPRSPPSGRQPAFAAPSHTDLRAAA